MAQSYNSIAFLMTITIIHVASQTVWLDIDTGKVLGVSPVQGQQQQRPQQQYRHHNNGNFHRRHNWQQQNPGGQMPYTQQIIDNLPNNIDGEWVCRNSKTGDMMVIASEINNRSPEQPRSNYYDNPNQNNPWLDESANQPGETLNNQNNPQNPINNNENIPKIVQQSTTTEALTEAPIILTTTKNSFPIPDNIDWTKYLETTTKKSSPPSLNRAIDGEGIIMPRGGNY